MAQLQPKAAELRPEEFDFSSRRELQSGGFARVYAIKLHGEEVAVKVPHVIGALDEEISYFIRIAHRNIVQFLGSVHYDNRTCVVLELAPKGSVSDLIKSGDLTLLRTSRNQWMLETARAVRYLHFDAPTQIVHGDLKGSNILVFDTPDGGTVAKVTDFGQARAILATTSVRDLGSHLWTAPEVLADKGHSLKSDVWSFGATVVELFSEVVPYNHLHQREPREIKKVLRKVEDRELDPLSGLQVTWPEGLLRLLQRCFQTKHRERPSMEEVLRELVEALPEDSGPRPRPPIRPQSLCLSVWNPDGNGEVATMQVRAEKNFGEVLTSARRLLKRVPVGGRSVSFSDELEFCRDRERRKAIVCFDPETGNFLRVDQEDGQEVDPGSRTLLIQRFLNDHSALPESARFAPSVIIWNNTELFQVTPQRSLEAAPTDALLLPKFVTFLCGIKCGTEHPRFFWRICTDKPEGEYLSPDARIMVGMEAIEDPRERSHFIVLLQDGDRPPSVPLPARRELEVFHRLGANVDVEYGRLKATLAPFFADLERWVVSVKASIFMKKISAAARRK